MPKLKNRANGTPFDIVDDMEDDVHAVRQLADAMFMMAHALDDQHALAVQRVAMEITRHAEEIERRRGDLFRVLHPDRAHFEKAGWPNAEITPRAA
jgi:hypothetical protein